jgi:uncharacterized membrane protein
MLLGFLFADMVLHFVEIYAMGLPATTMGERIGAVMFGVIALFILMVVMRRYFNNSCYKGFVVATGLFLSFDIVVFHWIFQLHRITNGPEANIFEPIFVVVGTIFVIYGLRKERKDSGG